MSNLNDLLSNIDSQNQQNRNNYLKNLAISNVEKHYNNLTNELNDKIEGSEVAEQIGSTLIALPQAREGLQSSSKKLLDTANRIRNNIKSRQNERLKIDNSKLEGNTEEDQIRPAEPVENLPDFTNLDSLPSRNTFRMQLPSQSERYGIISKAQDTSNIELNHISNANNERVQPTNEINNDDLSEAKRGLKILKDALPETEEGLETSTGIFEGLGLGAASEGFINPVLDIAAVGGGIASLLTGIFEGRKKKKEEAKEKLEEQSKISQIQNDPNFNRTGGQLTAANISNQNIISEGATTSF